VNECGLVGDPIRHAVHVPAVHVVYYPIRRIRAFVAAQLLGYGVAEPDPPVGVRRLDEASGWESAATVFVHPDGQAQGARVIGELGEPDTEVAFVHPSLDVFAGDEDPDGANRRVSTAFTPCTHDSCTLQHYRSNSKGYVHGVILADDRGQCASRDAMLFEWSREEDLKVLSKFKAALAAVAFVVAGSLPSLGSAFPIVAQLIGDPRPGNPDSLIIDVTITEVDADTVHWLIDINSPLHVDVKLDEFYFNVVTPAGGSYTFDGFNPADWDVDTPATTAGGGGIAFHFEALDPPGPPNAADVTNATSLEFNMHLGGGPTFTDALFLLAASSCSNDATLGCGQLGAHLQSLTLGNPNDPATSDSGFVLGTYLTPAPPPLPEPGTLSLLGAMFLALGLVHLRRRRR
jgi:hypothetical protein